MSKTNLDSLNPFPASGGNLTALENKVNSLAQITAKTNIAQTFTATQTFQNGARNNATITNNKDVVTKEYVDNYVGLWTELINWTGNFKTTTLNWTKSGNFPQGGRFEFLIELKYNEVFYNINFILNIQDVTKKYFTPCYMYSWNTPDPSTIKPLPTGGFYMVYDNKQIKIIKVGENQPTDSTVRILYRGVK